MQIQRLTDNQLLLIVRSETAEDAGMSNLSYYTEMGISPFVWSQIRVMACEILEYRMSYGDLGCETLDPMSGAFTQMVFKP